MNILPVFRGLDRIPVALPAGRDRAAGKCDKTGAVLRRAGHELGTAPLGQGDQDLRLLRIIKQSGCNGPVGIILEVNADAETRLQDNLDRLDWLVPQLEGKPPAPRPKPRSWKKTAAPNTKVDH